MISDKGHIISDHIISDHIYPVKNGAMVILLHVAHILAIDMPGLDLRYSIRSQRLTECDL